MWRSIDSIDTNCTLMFTLQCELTDDQSIKSESSILMTIANKVELVSKELNHFGGITSFFQDCFSAHFVPKNEYLMLFHRFGSIKTP